MNVLYIISLVKFGGQCLCAQIRDMDYNGCNFKLIIWTQVFYVPRKRDEEDIFGGLIFCHFYFMHLSIFIFYPVCVLEGLCCV